MTMNEDEKRQSHVTAATKYNKTNVKQIKINLNRKTDADIIDYLDQCSNIQGKIKELIRIHMKK